MEFLMEKGAVSKEELVGRIEKLRGKIRGR